ncbi:hypothetical protein HPB48_001517 [Haemaphysalis longicornis]|uniref:Uncharacterized protein n=1 Tax=Haemaphysalis longicornis TaxID=44386 RepID=A0A9J6GZ34_HAELO|nr:hypothetical protein HPB48_001517 [Haemaphysalis longicornis]
MQRVEVVVLGDLFVTGKICPGLHCGQLPPRWCSRMRSSADNEALSTCFQEACNVLHRSQLVFQPVEKKENVYPVKLLMLSKKISDITFDIEVHEVKILLGRMLLHVLDHNRRTVDTNEYYAWQASRKKAVLREVARSTTEVEVLRRFVISNAEREVKYV